MRIFSTASQIERPMRALCPALQRAAFFLFCLIPLLLALSRAAADIAVCTIGALFLARCAWEKHWQWLKHPALQLLAILWIYMMASSLLAENPVSAFQKAFAWGRLPLLLAAMSAWVLTSATALDKAARAGLVIAALLMIDAGWQYATGVSLSGQPAISGRLSGPLSQPSIGNLLLKAGFPWFGLLFYRLATGENKPSLILAALFFMAFVTIIMLSGERSSTMLLLLGAAAAGIIVFTCWPPVRRTLAAAAALGVLAMTLLAATQPVIQVRARDLSQQVSTFWDTPYGQLHQAAYGLWREHPVFGVGVGQFRTACPQRMEALGITYCDIHPHNFYLEWLADTGLIGLALFVAALIVLSRHMLRAASFTGRDSIPAAFACATLILLLFPVMITQSAFSNWSGMLFWYSLGFAYCLPRAAKRV